MKPLENSTNEYFCIGGPFDGKVMAAADLYRTPGYWQYKSEWNPRRFIYVWGEIIG